ncbi:MAG: hypothetical protein Q9217_003167 [Psora testacea]
MKRSDLATPSGIDHDYNYLTSIEREFDRAEKEATSRGVLLELEEKRHGPVKGEANLNAALERCGVIVSRAPKGMSRSKLNATRWTKGSQSIRWTVEWVHPDGRKELGQCQDNVPIFEAYGMLNGAPESLRPKKRKRAHQRQENEERRKKPSAYEGGSLSQKALNAVTKSAPRENGSLEVQGQGEGQGWTQKDNETGPCFEHEVETVKTHIHRDTGSRLVEPVDSQIATEEADHISPSRLPPLPNISFYLHTPSRPSRHPVLAPLCHDTTLNTGLRNRLVLEFPTIYVFENLPGGKLPEGFISEDDFYRMARKELIEEIDEGELVEEVSTVGEGRQSDGLDLEKMDKRKLLEVLGKDLEAE